MIIRKLSNIFIKTSYADLKMILKHFTSHKHFLHLTNFTDVLSYVRTMSRNNYWNNHSEITLIKIAKRMAPDLVLSKAYVSFAFLVLVSMLPLENGKIMIASPNQLNH